MPPSDGPSTQATRSIPSVRSASRPARAMSSTAISGKFVPYGRPVRGSIDTGLEEPNGLPSELMQTTKKRRVSIGLPSPSIGSHQPGFGSAGDDATCAGGDRPVKITTTLSRAAFRRPQVSYATTGCSSTPPRYRRSGAPRIASRVPGNSSLRLG